MLHVVVGVEVEAMVLLERRALPVHERDSQLVHHLHGCHLLERDGEAHELLEPQLRRVAEEAARARRVRTLKRWT